MMMKTISAVENMTSPLQSVKRILIIEDQSMVSEMLKFILESKGYVTVIARDFMSAQEQLEQESFTLVLLDLNLPNGNGLDLLTQARTLLHLNTPFIILSALKQEMNILSGLNLGANDYITKPFSPRELLLRINKVLESN